MTYLAKSGLTPPTKHIRQRYFRKDLPISEREMQEIESEIVDIQRVAL